MFSRALKGRQTLGRAEDTLPSKARFLLLSKSSIRAKSPRFYINSTYAITLGSVFVLASRYKIISGILATMKSSYGIQGFFRGNTTGKYDVGGKVTFALVSPYAINFVSTHTVVSKYSLTLPFVKNIISRYTIIGSLLLVNKSNCLKVKDRNRTINIKR